MSYVSYKPLLSFGARKYTMVYKENTLINIIKKVIQLNLITKIYHIHMKDDMG